MPDREKVIRGFEACQVEEDGYTTLCKANGCPYNVSSTHCMTNLHKDALALLKEQEKEIKALRKLLDWAMECDFGIDNLGDWWAERFAEEIEGMGYKESLIHLAKRYIEVFEGGDGDA